MKGVYRCSVLLAGLLLFSINAMADKNTYTMSVGLGNTRFDLNQAGLINGYSGLGNSSTFTDSATSFNFSAGMQLDEYLSLEMDMVITGDVTGRDSNQSFKLFDVSSFAVLLGLSHPMSERITLISRLGVHFWDLSESFGSQNTINNAVDLAYGIGVDINVYGAKSRQLRLLWSRYNYDGIFLHSSDVFSINLLFTY